MDKGLNVIADYYGERPQLAQLQEECAELIVACSKVLRYGYSDQASEELTEELAALKKKAKDSKSKKLVKTEKYVSTFI